MNALYLFLSLNLAVSLVAFAIITALMIRGTIKYIASRLWISLLIGLDLTELISSVFCIIEIVLTEKKKHLSPIVRYIALSINGLGWMSTAIVHWLFSYRYWILGRKIKQLGIPHITTGEASKLKIIGWLGAVSNALFVFWF